MLSIPRRPMPIPTAARMAPSSSDAKEADEDHPYGHGRIETLASLLGLEVDLSGVEDTQPMLARVAEATCIGCTRCFKVCPTDAIIGAPRQIHAVLQDACTGCGNCVEICPTECLQMFPIEVTLGTWRWPKPRLAA